MVKARDMDRFAELDVDEFPEEYGDVVPGETTQDSGDIRQVGEYAFEVVSSYKDEYGEVPEDIDEIPASDNEAEALDEYMRTLADSHTDLLDIDMSGELGDDYVDGVLSRTFYDGGKRDFDRAVRSARYNRIEVPFSDFVPDRVRRMVQYGVDEEYEPLNDEEFGRLVESGELEGGFTEVETLPEKAPDSGVLMISSDRLPESHAFLYSAAELFHDIQFRLNSDTFEDKYFHEGLERACTMKALERGVEEGIITEEQYKGALAHTANQGYKSLMARRVIGFRATPTSMTLGGANLPEGEWDIEPRYNIGATAILSADDSDVFADVFRGKLDSEIPVPIGFTGKRIDIAVEEALDSLETEE